jgi:hypothetical protein
VASFPVPSPAADIPDPALGGDADGFSRKGCKNRVAFAASCPNTMQAQSHCAKLSAGTCKGEKWSVNHPFCMRVTFCLFVLIAYSPACWSSLTWTMALRAAEVHMTELSRICPILLLMRACRCDSQINHSTCCLPCCTCLATPAFANGHTCISCRLY